MTKPITETPSLDCCDFHVVLSAQPAVSEILSYYERMRAYVEHEDDLINSRLTWSLTVHGFLFAIFGLLLGKAADMFIELHKLTAPASPKLLEHLISGLFFFQLPVAVVGVFISLYSREAVVGAHNAIQHVYAIAHSSGGALRFRPDTSVPASIARGEQKVTPKSMLGIVVNAQLLVHNGRESEEAVTVNAVDANTFTATFTGDHAAGASLTLVGPILLPKIIDGGAPPSNTGRTSSYYLGLPSFMMGVWIFLFIASVIFCALSLFKRCGFFWYVGGVPC